MFTVLLVLGDGSLRKRPPFRIMSQSNALSRRFLTLPESQEISVAFGENECAFTTILRNLPCSQSLSF